MNASIYVRSGLSFRVSFHYAVTLYTTLGQYSREAQEEQKIFVCKYGKDFYHRFYVALNIFYFFVLYL